MSKRILTPCPSGCTGVRSWSEPLAPGGAYHGNFGRETSVIVDYPFVTGRSNHDSYLTGQQMVEVLKEGLRHRGFHNDEG